MPRYASLVERLAEWLAYTDDGCLVWIGSKRRDGYARITTGSRTDGTRRVALVHRVVWEAVVGPIPEGLELDHLCRNRACARPDHLEPVTGAVNTRRAMPTECKQGHAFTTTNTYWRIDRKGQRACRACNREKQRKARTTP